MLDASHIHPMIVHFPIALVIIGFMFDIISLFNPKNEINFKISYYLLVIGSVTAVISQLSGLYLTNHPKSGELYLVFEQHELFALISVILLIATTIIGTLFTMKYSKYLRYVYSFLYLLSMLSIAYTGFLGGTMVYDYMIGL
jgi:uncharacterized membrane protein